MPAEKCLTINEFVAFLREESGQPFCRRTVEQWIADGLPVASDPRGARLRMPVVRDFGKRVLVRLSEWRAWQQTINRPALTPAERKAARKAETAAHRAAVESLRKRGFAI